MTPNRTELTRPLFIIWVEEASNHYTYTLAPESQERLARFYPQAKPLSPLIIGRSLHWSHGPSFERTDAIVSLLTGLSLELLHVLGHLQFRRPNSKRVLWTLQLGTDLPKMPVRRRKTWEEKCFEALHLRNARLRALAGWGLPLSGQWSLSHRKFVLTLSCRECLQEVEYTPPYQEYKRARREVPFNFLRRHEKKVADLYPRCHHLPSLAARWNKKTKALYELELAFGPG